MVRNVMLGAASASRRRSVESGLMSGSNRRQLLWWVQLPSALPTILIGVNQTVMAGLSMVVIAAMVGGVDDIGLEVFNTMKQAKFGQSLLAGPRHRAARDDHRPDQPRLRLPAAGHGGGRDAPRERWPRSSSGPRRSSSSRWPTFVPALRTYPEAWVFYPARGDEQRARVVHPHRLPGDLGDEGVDRLLPHAAAQDRPRRAASGRASGASR